MQDVAFVNPDGSKALVAYNSRHRADDVPRAVGRPVVHVHARRRRGGDVHLERNPARQGRHDRDRIGGHSASPTQTAAVRWSATTQGCWRPGPGASRRPVAGLLHPDRGSFAPLVTPCTLPRDSWTVSASASSPDDPAGNVIDGDATTRWSTGHGMMPATGSRSTSARHRRSAGRLDTRQAAATSSAATRSTSPTTARLGRADREGRWAYGPGSSCRRSRRATSAWSTQGSSGSWWSIHELTVSAIAESAGTVTGSAGSGGSGGSAGHRADRPDRRQRQQPCG